MVLVDEVIDEGLGTIVSPRCIATDSQLILNGLVAVHVTIVRVVLARQLRHGLQCSIETEVNLRLTFLTTLGGNQNNTVSTFHTVNGSSRCVLQHGDRSD